MLTAFNNRVDKTHDIFDAFHQSFSKLELHHFRVKTLLLSSFRHQEGNRVTALRLQHHVLLLVTWQLVALNCVDSLLSNGSSAGDNPKLSLFELDFL